MNEKITFVVFTKNEEHRIENVILNFKNYGKILLADGGSTDRTYDIAKKYGCDIYVREKEILFAENSYILDRISNLVTTPWMYWAYADEHLEKKSLDKISEIVEDDKYDLISINRKNYFYGAFCDNVHDSRVTRLFKKGSLDFTNNKIHSFGKPTVSKNRIYFLQNDMFIYHMISNNLETTISAFLYYSDVEKIQGIKSKVSFWHFIRLFMFTILKYYFKEGGWKLSREVDIFIQAMFIYPLLSNIKTYEYENNVTLQSIAQKNKKIVENILSDFQ